MYIKLTRFDNRPVWLNAAFVVTVEPRRDGSGSVVVPIGDGLDYDVRESPEEVLRMLEGCPAPQVVPVPVSDCLTKTPADVSPEPERKTEKADNGKETVTTPAREDAGGTVTAPVREGADGTVNMERLQNILAHAGVASRRGAAALIESGVVTVDGIVVKEPGARFEIGSLGSEGSGPVIRVNGKTITTEEKHRTIVLYKPVGVLSTMSDPFGGKTVAELVRTPERLVPIGRLDKDSEGLLLMSNDGTLVNELTHPRFNHTKTYLVKVAGRWSAEKLKTLRSPLTLDDGYTIRPVPVEVVQEWENNTRLLKFVLSEGRKRQIRKMCSAAHLVVLTLKRGKVGNFELPSDLQPGEWRDLTDAELKLLR